MTPEEIKSLDDYIAKRRERWEQTKKWATGVQDHNQFRRLIRQNLFKRIKLSAKQIFNMLFNRNK